MSSFDTSKLKNSRFLKKEDVGDGLDATIKSVTEEDVGLESVELKWALNFKEAGVKPMILNGVNGDSIAEVCGGKRDTDWIGKKICLYHDPNVTFAGKRCGGLRVRKPAEASAAPATAAAPATEAPAADTAFDDDIPF